MDGELSATNLANPLLPSTTKGGGGNDETEAAAVIGRNIRNLRHRRPRRKTSGSNKEKATSPPPTVRRPHHQHRHHRRRSGEAPRWPPPLVAMEFDKSAPADTMAWFVIRLQDPLDEGGVEAYIRIVPPTQQYGTVLLLTASPEFAMKVALTNRLAVWTPLERIQGANMDGGLPTSERQRLFLWALYSMPVHEGEVSSGIPGREQMELFEGESVVNRLLVTGVIKRVYPLHEPDRLTRLMRAPWATSLFSMEHWDEVREYFGPEVAVHFAFYSFLSWAIAWTLAVSFLASVFSVVSTGEYEMMYGMLSLSNMGMAVVFPKLWRQKCSSLADRWGILRWDQEASKADGQGQQVQQHRVRPEFLGEDQYDHVTGRWEKRYPMWKRVLWMGGVSTPVILLFLVMGMTMQMKYLTLHEKHHQMLFVSAGAAMVNSSEDPAAHDGSAYGSSPSFVTNQSIPIPPIPPDMPTPENSPPDLTPNAEKQPPPPSTEKQPPPPPPPSVEAVEIPRHPQTGTWGYWIGLRIMTLFYAAFVVFVSYLAHWVVNVTNEWENYRTQEAYDRAKVFKLATVLFVINFLPVYVVLSSRKSVAWVVELFLFAMGVDLMTAYAKRFMVRAWVVYCVGLLHVDAHVSPRDVAHGLKLTKNLTRRRMRTAAKSSGETESSTESSSTTSSTNTNTTASSTASSCKTVTTTRGKQQHHRSSPRRKKANPWEQLPRGPSRPAALHLCLPPAAEDIQPMTFGSQGNIGQWVSTATKAEIKEWELRTDARLLSYEGWFHDHDEVLVRLGREFLFPILLPVNTMVALLGHMLIVRGDGKLLCSAIQRPVSSPDVRGLGTNWQMALEVECWIILLTNCATFYLSLVSRLDTADKYWHMPWLVCLIVLEMAAISLKLFVKNVVPDVGSRAYYKPRSQWQEREFPTAAGCSSIFPGESIAGIQMSPEHEEEKPSCSSVVPAITFPTTNKEEGSRIYHGVPRLLPREPSAAGVPTSFPDVERDFPVKNKLPTSSVQMLRELLNYEKVNDSKLRQLRRFEEKDEREESLDMALDD